MFKINKIYSGHKGSVNLSIGSQGSTINSVTKGIALKYVAKGEEIYRLGKNDIAVYGGEFIILPNDQHYHAEIYTQNNAHGMCIDLLTNQIETSPLESLYGFVFKIENAPELSETIQELFFDRSCDLNLENSVDSISDRIGTFSESTQTYCDRLSHHTKKQETRLILVDKLLTAKKNIDRNFDKKLSLQELSKNSGMSSYYLNRLFNLCFENPPLQYQIKIRMQAARTLLAKENQSLSNIAYKLGYTDLASFSKQFKSYFNCSPSDYRN